MNINHPDAVDSLLSIAFNDPSAAVRKLALRSVVLSGNSRMVVPLVNAIGNAGKMDDRLEYIDAVREIGGDEAEAELGKLAQSAESRIRSKAKISLDYAISHRGIDKSDYFEKKKDRCFYMY